METTTAAAEKGVRLRVTEVVLLQLRRCWHPSVFLTPLAHRFWKVSPLTWFQLSWFKTSLLLLQLSLQLLARYATLVRSSCSADVGMSCQLLLLLDSFALADQSRLVLRDVIEPQLGELGCDTAQCAATFRPAFEEGLQAILAAAEAVERRLGDRIETDCATHLRLVQDVPRQYRKTNREVSLSRDLCGKYQLAHAPLVFRSHPQSRPRTPTIFCDRCPPS